MHVREGDTVVVLTGSDRKKTGTVLQVLRERDAVVVSGVNIRTIHRKPRTRGEKGTIERVERPIHISNISLLDPKEKKATRVGFTGTGSEKKRIARKSGTPIPFVSKERASKKRRVAATTTTPEQKEDTSS